MEISKNNKYIKKNQYIYQYLISKLMYFVYRTKLDITFVISQLNTYNTNPKNYF